MCFQSKTLRNKQNGFSMQKKTDEEWLAEVQELRTQLEEAQETLNAIKRGEVDGLVISTPKGEEVYTITGAEKPYRALIEDMREGAVMLSDDNTVLYSNIGFAKMLKVPMEKMVGVKIETMICPTYIKAFEELLTLGRTRKGAVTKEITLQGKDILVPTLISINSLQSDTIKNTFLVVTDLSEHMDEEIKRYTRKLELAQIALSESEQRWATTLASIGDAVIATDTSGNITFMNSEAEELTGWTLSDVSEKPVKTVFNIVNEQTRLEVENPIERVLKEGMVVGLANHTVLIRKDGSEVPIDDSGAPIKDKDGKTTGVVLIFRDITERKKAEEEITRLASFPTLNPNPIVEMDFDGKIEYINPAAKAMFADLETLGLNHPFFASWKSVTKAFTEKTANIFACEVKIGDDWYLQNYSNVPNAQRIRVYALKITERKKAEEALQQQKVVVQEERDRLSSLLNSITDEVWFADTEKKFTLANPSAVKDFKLDSSTNSRY